MKVIVDSLVTHYTKSGDGPVVLLLHGWGDSKETFSDLKKNLKSSFTVVTVDLPGFGNTDTPNDTFTLKTYAEFVHSFMSKIGIDQVYAVVGHSNGGAIAIKSIALAELEPKKLVLLASSGVRSTYKGRKKAVRMAAKAAKLPTKLMPSKIQTKLKKKAYSSIGSDMFVAEHLQSTFRAVVGEDLLAAAGSISADTLLLYGSKDTATLPAYGELFAEKIPKSELHIIEGADHFLHHTHANSINEKVLEFLS